MSAEMAKSEDGEQSIQSVLDSSIPPRIQVGTRLGQLLSNHVACIEEEGMQAPCFILGECVRVCVFGGTRRKEACVHVTRGCFQNACGFYTQSRPLHSQSRC